MNIHKGREISRALDIALLECLDGYLQASKKIEEADLHPDAKRILQPITHAVFITQFDLILSTTDVALWKSGSLN